MIYNPFQSQFVCIPSEILIVDLDTHHYSVCLSVSLFVILFSVWKIGNYFGSDRLSLGRTFLYGVTCI